MVVRFPQRAVSHCTVTASQQLTVSSLRFVSFLLRYAHDKSLDETKVFTPEDIETMLFDQITKLAVQILKPEPAIGLSDFQFPGKYAPSFRDVGIPLGSRGVGGADQYGPVPDFIEM